MKYCTKCGKPISNGEKFCKHCGNPIINIDNEIEKTQYMDISNFENDTNDMDKNKEYVSHKASEVFGNNFNNEKNQQPKNKTQRSIFSGVAPKVIIAVVLIIAILTGVFFNRIRCEYYMAKSNSGTSQTEKIDYAIKAVKVLNSSDTKNLLKNTIVKAAENDVDLAEQKLQEVSGILSQGDFQNIAIDVKGKKVDKLCSQSKYEDALNEFNEIDKLGGDFKTNKNYDNVMMNVISKLTGTPVRTSKNSLMESDGITFDNFEPDIFDEVIEVKGKSSYYSNAEIKVNLYKFKDGKYKLVDTKTINNAFRGKLEGAYTYAADKKGVYISYETNSNGFATCVFGGDNSKLVLKGTVLGNNYTKPEDVDNDGIYEILSNSTSYVYSSSRDTSKWYKMNEDGNLTEVTVGGTAKFSTNTSSASSGDYILKDSDKAYLMEDDLRGLSKDQLALARNEIFARHGYVFKEEKYKNYFTAKGWYVSNPNYDGNDSALNEYEKANYQTIQDWEKK
jgi:hypothetical protein